MKKAVIVSLICILLIVSLNLIFAESIKITVKAVGEGVLIVLNQKVK